MFRSRRQDRAGHRRLAGHRRGVARRLAAQGARVVRRGAHAREARGARGRDRRARAGARSPLALDLAAAGDVRRAHRDACPRSSRRSTSWSTTPASPPTTCSLRMCLEEWERVLRTNLTGAFALTKEVVRGMMRARWGRIITVSSVVGLMGNAGQANYAAAKAGLIGFSQVAGARAGQPQHHGQRGGARASSRPR